MPELPEVETIIRELRPRLKNQTIKRVEVMLSKMVSLGPATVSNLRKLSGSTANKFAQTLRGQTITRVSRRAKMIIIDLAGRYTLLIHLKMTGQLIFRKRSELSKPLRLWNNPKQPPVILPAKSTHVIFEFTNGSKLFFNDFRQFGYLKLVTDTELLHVRELKEYGPEPFDLKYAYAHFRLALNNKPNARIKLFLVDPQMIAGIGNIYSDEILFYAKVRPARRVKSLSANEQRLIFQGIKKILRTAIKYHGSSVGEFVRPSGAWGKYGLQHQVYGRAGQKCKVCGTMVASQKFNGRTGSYCPKCQK